MLTSYLRERTSLTPHIDVLPVLHSGCGYFKTSPRQNTPKSKCHRTGQNVSNYYPPTKSEGYSFGVALASVRPSVRPSGHTFCLSRTISQYLFVRFDSFLVQKISTTDSRYPISLVKIDLLTHELLPLFWYKQL